MARDRGAAVSTVDPLEWYDPDPSMRRPRLRDVSGVGVTIRETMSGHLAIGERDPRLGDRVARARGSMLRLRATLHIPDLAAFLADPDHTGRLTGTVDSSSFGTLSGGRGVFRLFTPSPHAPRMRLMEYELPLVFDGQPCYLAGEKIVAGGPSWRLWPETTTLLTRLHDGPTRHNEIIGAGILRLGIGRILALLLTLRATNAASTAEGAGAILRFSRFFAGQLGERYAPRLRLFRADPRR